MDGQTTPSWWLCNPQVIRTAEMMDMRCVVFVRSKCPTDEMIRLAKESDLVVLKTTKRMYEACGKLYLAGLGVSPTEAKAVN